MFEKLQEKNGPFEGLVKHYWYRVEYQKRGAPHIHSILWIKDAPVIGKDSPQDIMNFISRFITCRMPDQVKEPEMHKFVSKYQVHKHTGI
jgi:hypothetical protein